MFADSGPETSLGTLPGSEINPAISVGSSGALVVWQDSTIDRKGFGIAALQLDSNFLPVGSRFLVNLVPTENQVHPRVVALANGSALFVWEGGKRGFQDILARVRNSAGKWATGDLFVNTYRKGVQKDPSLTVLSNGNLVVLWTSTGQGRAGDGIIGQRLAPTGRKLGGEFRVNSYTNFNQRDSAVAPLGNGGFVAVWVSELQRFRRSVSIFQSGINPPAERNSVDVFGRLFDATGHPASDEFLINTSSNVCARPTVQKWGDGFAVAWDESSWQGTNRNADVFLRIYDGAGAPLSEPAQVNEYAPYMQTGPRLAVTPSGGVVLWTSNGQAHFVDAIYGRLLGADGSFSGGEFPVSADSPLPRSYPDVSSSADGAVIGVWSGYVKGSGFDIFSKRLQ